MTLEDQVRIAEVLRAAADPRLAQAYADQMTKEAAFALQMHRRAAVKAAKQEAAEVRVGRPVEVL